MIYYDIEIYNVAKNKTFLFLLYTPIKHEFCPLIDDKLHRNIVTVAVEP